MLLEQSAEAVTTMCVEEESSSWLSVADAFAIYVECCFI
jgi:hypothetical protein